MHQYICVLDKLPLPQADGKLLQSHSVLVLNYKYDMNYSNSMVQVIPTATHSLLTMSHRVVTDD